MVVVFGAEWCPACKMAEAFLRRNRVVFESRDIDQDAGARTIVRLYGDGNVPLIEVDGEYIKGFDRQRLTEKLGLGEGGGFPWWGYAGLAVGGLIAAGAIRMSWFYHRYGKRAEQRCKGRKSRASFNECVCRELNRMGAPGARAC